MPTSKKKRQQRAVRGQKAELATQHRQTIYPTISVCIYKKDTDEGPITADMAKDLLGWQEEEGSTQLGKKFDAEVTRMYGSKVRLTNNINNRPLTMGVVKSLKQEHLRGRWCFNGEPIIVGKTGLILNGQHTLISLILAVKEWDEAAPGDFPNWDESPVMEKLVVYGVPEDDETINTMDTCKPRSLAEVIYRAAYFKNLNSRGRRVTATMAGNAVKMLWQRVGVPGALSTVHRTHAESIAFLNDHPRLLDSVRHIYEEDSGEGKISKYLSLGYASAALYLMAASGSDSDSYYAAESPSESKLNFDYWDKACEFFVELAAGSQSLKSVKDAIVNLVSNGGGRWEERWAILVMAWNVYKQGKPVTAKTVSLKFETVEETRVLVSSPLLGGIDIGQDGLQFRSNGDPNKHDIAKRATKVKNKKFGTPKEGNRKQDQWSKGDTAWALESGGDPFFCTLIGDPYKCTDGITRVMVSADDLDCEVAVHNLSLKQFEKV